MTKKNLTSVEIVENYKAQEAFREMKQQLAILEKTRENTTDRSTKILLGKEIKLVQAEIAKREGTFTPIWPISPNHLLEQYIIAPLSNLVKQFEKNKVDFLERFAFNPADAIEYSDTLIKNQAKAQKAQTILKFVEAAEGDELAKIEKFLEIWDHIVKENARDMNSFMRRGASGSTNEYYNLTQKSKMAGLAELEENHRLEGIFYMLENLECWKVLKEAGLLTEKE